MLCSSQKGLSLIAEDFGVGQVVEGKVTRILPYGAMIEIGEGVTGLLHISQIADQYVREVGEHLRLGDMVKARIVGVKEPGKYQLSIKALTSPTPAGGERGPGERRVASRDLEDKLAEFMKASQKRQAELRKTRDNKRGGGRRR